MLVPTPTKLNKSQFCNPKPQELPQFYVGKGYYFHVTHDDNIDSIIETGLHIDKSKSPPGRFIWASTKPDAFYGQDSPTGSLVVFKSNSVIEQGVDSVIIAHDVLPSDILFIDRYMSTPLGSKRLSGFRDNKYCETYYEQCFANKTLIRNSSKVEIPTGKTIYVYSDAEKSRRKHKKLKHCNNMTEAIDSLIETVTTDIKLGDDVACVVGIILCTYERVGNDSSARNGHYGACNLEKRHIGLGQDNSHLTLMYVAKSGVKQVKEISEPSLCKEILKRARKIAFTDRIFNCTPAQVNKYLAAFGITSKDIRTFAANKFMVEEMRKSGSVFKNSLNTVAKIIGHKPATLKSQYLHDKVKEKYGH